MSIKWSDKNVSMPAPRASESGGNIGFCRWSLENAPRLPQGEKKIIIPSHGPGNSFQCWLCQIIRTQTEEAFIIVIYDTLPKMAAPESSGRAKTKWLWKKCVGSGTRPSSTRSQKPKPDRGWGWFQIKMGLRSCESSKKIFCYRIVNQVIMSPVSPPSSQHRHRSCSSLWLKSM